MYHPRTLALMRQGLMVCAWSEKDTNLVSFLLETGQRNNPKRIPKVPSLWMVVVSEEGSFRPVGRGQRRSSKSKQWRQPSGMATDMFELL